VAFFDGAAEGRPLAILGVWAALGLALAALGSRRQTPGRHEDTPDGSQDEEYAFSR